MSYAYASRRRLTAAVTAVLAVTLGATALTVPANADTTDRSSVSAAAGAAATTDAVISIPRTTRIISAGPSGFLAEEWTDAGGYVYRWTSTVDGTTTVLPAQGSYFGGFSDSVVTREPTRSLYRVYDMSSPGGTYQSISPSSDLSLRAVVGTTLVMSRWNTTDHTGELRLVTRGVDAQSDRPVTGLKPNPRILKAEPTSVSTANVFYTAVDADDTLREYLAVVDTVTASVVEQREVSSVAHFADLASSGSRLAWVEAPTTSTARLMYAERGGEVSAPAVEAVPLGNRIHTHIGALGDWITYASPGATTAAQPDQLHALTALNVTNGAKVKLLDHAMSSVPAPDGSLLVRGGTVAGGEGVYRVAVGENNAITATLIASTGESTALKLLEAKTPTVLDLDQNGGKATLEWTLSRSSASGTVTLRHVRTGRTAASHTFDYSGNGISTTGVVTVNWSGLIEGEHAPNGDYTWEFNATPTNGIGPAMKATGVFTVVRKANPHDFNDNGSTDLLARDASGVLWRDDLVRSDTSAGIYAYQRVKVGTGWQIYDQIEAAGNLAGAPAGDVVARDTSGVLWSYLGKGDGTFAPRTKIGTGWQVYNKIAAGSDLTGDGRPDLLATDTTGALWLYKGTGVWNAPYSARTKIGSGWGVYNQITAVGDIAGGPAGDLVARDKDGVLWSYLGKGDGTFAARTKIGEGWNAYTQLVGAGDVDRDGRADLIAYGPGGTHLYRGTGDWSVPLAPKWYTSLYAGEGTKFNPVS
ncbi:FG-GAP repeat domain-containing protein [Streptomyces lateritius]|uniref:FG-GAP repeat domain-containing protein n=1 Tax=Streptomyces lateritius TaxID=67313 RepID=UPI0019B32B95|nr:VCBS repeat-containing protein [Streptomyces lateritius]GGT87625.1 hypothetical protein GCM10010272_35480 [Streptomyces lateritius]